METEMDSSVRFYHRVSGFKIQENKIVWKLYCVTCAKLLSSSREHPE